MQYPESPYVEQRGTGLYVAGTRVSLNSVVINFQKGSSPEQIQQSFDSLRLSQVYGAIAYYLDNQTVIDQYLAAAERRFKESQKRMLNERPEVFERLRALSEQSSQKQP